MSSSSVRRSGRSFRPRAIAALVLSLGATACDTRLDPQVAYFTLDASGTRDTTGLVVTPGAVVLLVGESVQLNATGDPVLLPVSWRSSDPRVAVVSVTGVVTAVGRGAARITAQSINNPSRQAIAVVQVVGQTPIP